MTRCLVYGALLIALTLLYFQIAYANPVKEYGTMCTLYVNGIKVSWPTGALRGDECKTLMDTLAKGDKTHASIICKCMVGGKV